MKRYLFAIIAIFTVIVAPNLAVAKRTAPKGVAPVEYEGVRYQAPLMDGRRAYIEAWDIATNKKLWEATVFKNFIKPWLEEDVQWVYISAFTIENDHLRIIAEDGRRFLLDLKTKQITQLDD